MEALKLGDKLLCKYDFPMSYVCKGGKYTFKSYDSVLEGFINLVEHKGKYSMDCFKQINTNEHELSWTHEGSALVSLMLQEGFKYIMCEIGEEDKRYLDGNEQPTRFIIKSQDDGGIFIDTKGDMWQSVQAINNDGTVMTYDDYLMLKQLKEMKHGRLE